MSRRGAALYRFEYEWYYKRILVTEAQSRYSDSAERAYDANGVDLTLIRWMLSLTPIERIEHVQQMADSLQELRSLNGIPEPDVGAFD